MENAASVSGQGAADAGMSVTPVTGTGAMTEINNGNPGHLSSGYEWLNGADETTVGYVQNKGWTDPRQVLDGYRNLEKLLGADKANNAVIIPKSIEDADGWNSLYDRLGRPSDPNGYGLKTGVADPNFDQAISQKFHELGLTRAQGEQFGAWLGDMITQGQTSEAQQQQMAFAQQDVELRGEWGAAYTQNLNNAQVAARGLGLEAETIDKISGAIGHKATMELLARVGSGMKEDSFVTGNEANGFGSAMTPAQAKAEIQTLMQDRDFVSKYTSGNKDARDKMSRLHSFAYPEG